MMMKVIAMVLLLAAAASALTPSKTPAAAKSALDLEQKSSNAGNPCPSATDETDCNVQTCQWLTAASPPCTANCELHSDCTDAVAALEFCDLSTHKCVSVASACTHADCVECLNDEHCEHAPGSTCHVATSECNAAVTASGDPHLVNIKGEAFDVLQAGDLNLITVPRQATPSDALLSVLTKTARAHPNVCESIFIVDVHVSGKWLGEAESLHVELGDLKHARPFCLKTGSSDCKHHDQLVAGKEIEVNKGWAVVIPTTEAGNKNRAFDVRFGEKVSLKIAVVEHRHLSFLNVDISGLKEVGMDIGGLLGMDDHSAASQASTDCSHKKMQHRELDMEDMVKGLASTMRASF